MVLKLPVLFCRVKASCLAAVYYVSRSASRLGTWYMLAQYVVLESSSQSSGLGFDLGLGCLTHLFLVQGLQGQCVANWSHVIS